MGRSVLLGSVRGTGKFCLAVLFNFVLLAASCRAEVLRQDDNNLARELKIPVATWTEPGSEPLAIVVAVHGLAMHGGTFDVMARNLVSRGFMVVAPDMRGYGRWLEGGKELAADQTINYDLSQKDIIDLLSKLHAGYPHVPVFCLGESLGADEALQVAASHPELVSGLVLSSPALKRRTYVNSKVLVDLTHLCTPHKQLDITPYIKRCASEDPRIIQAMLEDPLVRKHLSSLELLRSQMFMRATRKRVGCVPASMPVLVIQGDADRLLKSNAVVTLLKHLNSKDQTVRWFHERGHILLETAFVQTDTLETVQGWLVKHAKTVSGVETAQADRALPTFEQ